MKDFIFKIGVRIIALIFAVGVLGISVVNAISLTPTPNSQIMIVPSITPEPEINYILPYPGILPDNPFYTLKMIRDRLVLTFTLNPAEKTEKLLLYADKRLGAGKALIEGNKVELGVTTITKGEKYLEQSINQFKEIKDSNAQAQSLKERLVNAGLKHQEILEELSLRTPEPFRNQLTELGKKTMDKMITLIEE